MFFLIPVGVDYRTDRWPIVTFSIIGLCTGLYLLGVYLFVEQIGTINQLSDPMIDRFGLVPNRATPTTWVSHMFLHAGFLHLLGNMVYLFLFGAVIEDMIGRVKFAAFFLIGGLAAAAVHIIFSAPSSADIPMVGASGAISSCLGAFVILQPQTQVQFRYFLWLFIPFLNGEFTLPSWLVISFWFLKDVIGFVVNTINPHAGGGIAFGAHIGGAIAGLVIAVGLRAIQSSSRKNSRKDMDSEPSMDHRCIYVQQDGQKLGPYSPKEIRSMLQVSALYPESYYWQEGMTEWQSLDKYRD